MGDEHTISQLSSQVQTLVAIIAEMKDTVAGFGDKLEKVAVLEAGHQQHKIDVDRSFNMMRTMDARVQQLEIKSALHDKSSTWIDNGLKWIVALVGLAVLYSLFHTIPGVAAK